MPSRQTNKRILEPKVERDDISQVRRYGEFYSEVGSVGIVQGKLKMIVRRASDPGDSSLEIDHSFPHFPRHNPRYIINVRNRNVAERSLSSAHREL